MQSHVAFKYRNLVILIQTRQGNIFIETVDREHLKIVKLLIFIGMINGKRCTLKGAIIKKSTNVCNPNLRASLVRSVMSL